MIVFVKLCVLLQRVWQNYLARVPYEGAVDHVAAVNGQRVKAGDLLMSIRSQLATAEVRAPEAGVVLTSMPAESRFARREPIAWILPQAALHHDRELLAYVAFKDLRKVIGVYAK